MANRKSNIFKRGANAVSNYWFPITQDSSVFKPQVGTPDVKVDLSKFISPVQFQRYRQDILSWREAVQESEEAFFPQRVKMCRLNIDVVLNGHVWACMNKRKNLTLLKKFMLCDDTGKEAEDFTKMFKKQWFKEFMGYVLDTQYHGYTLISLGDLVDDAFPNVSVVRRWNVSPDRMNVTSYVYALSGEKFQENPYKDWHIYVKTQSENGYSKAGYGILYRVAQYEILIRNTLGFNADFVELFAQPFRVGKTTKSRTDERDNGLAAALAGMGSSGWAVIDPEDEIEFLAAGNAGEGWKGYENLEKRSEQKISKLILGHADAMDSVPGKLGSGQNKDNPVKTAMEECEAVDCDLVEHVVNEELLPRMRKLGVRIPNNLHFEFVNDGEAEEFREREDASNQVTAQIAQVLAQAGLQMDPAYFTERTGIPVKAVEMDQDHDEEDGEADKAENDNAKVAARIRKRLEDYYGGPEKKVA